MRKFVEKLLIFSIGLYRNLLSPHKLQTCRFYPSCSSYAVESIKKHGPYKGTLKAVFRVAKCNPFCKGGYDPV